MDDYTSIGVSKEISQKASVAAAQAGITKSTWVAMAILEKIARENQEEKTEQ